MVDTLHNSIDFVLYFVKSRLYKIKEYNILSGKCFSC
jgi:hypothetical protein